MKQSRLSGASLPTSSRPPTLIIGTRISMTAQLRPSSRQLGELPASTLPSSSTTCGDVAVDGSVQGRTGGSSNSSLSISGRPHCEQASDPSSGSSWKYTSHLSSAPGTYPHVSHLPWSTGVTICSSARSRLCRFIGSRPTVPTSPASGPTAQGPQPALPDRRARCPPDRNAESWWPPRPSSSTVHRCPS